MYEATVESQFSAAHNLREYGGKCERVHGHNWKVQASFVAEKLDKVGLVVDFAEAKEKLKEVLHELDHNFLNEVDYFRSVNPTSENIAKYIYDKLQCAMRNTRYALSKVIVWESDTTWASYSEK